MPSTQSIASIRIMSVWRWVNCERSSDRSCQPPKSLTRSWLTYAGRNSHKPESPFNEGPIGQLCRRTWKQRPPGCALHCGQNHFFSFVELNQTPQASECECMGQIPARTVIDYINKEKSGRRAGATSLRESAPRFRRARNTMLYGSSLRRPSLACAGAHVSNKNRAWEKLSNAHLAAASR